MATTEDWRKTELLLGENEIPSSEGIKRGETGGSGETNITRGFIIAKPRRRDSKSNRRVCLIYLIVNNSDNNNNNNSQHNSSVSYWWSVGKTECQRNILPGT